MTTVRALETLGPPHPKQLFLTGFLSAKLFLKLQQTKSLLLHIFTPFCYKFYIIIAYYTEQKQQALKLIYFPVKYAKYPF